MRAALAALLSIIMPGWFVPAGLIEKVGADHKLLGERDGRKGASCETMMASSHSMKPLHAMLMDLQTGRQQRASWPYGKQHKEPILFMTHVPSLTPTYACSKGRFTVRIPQSTQCLNMKVLDTTKTLE